MTPAAWFDDWECCHSQCQKCTTSLILCTYHLCVFARACCSCPVDAGMKNQITFTAPWRSSPCHGCMWAGSRPSLATRTAPPTFCCWASCSQTWPALARGSATGNSMGTCVRACVTEGWLSDRRTDWSIDRMGGYLFGGSIGDKSTREREREREWVRCSVARLTAAASRAAARSVCS